MSKRTVVLLVVAAGIWVAVLVYYFVFFKASPIRRANRVESAPRASEVSLNVTPEFLGKYEKIVAEKVEKPDLFSPYYTEKGKEYLKKNPVVLVIVVMSLENRGVGKGTELACKQHYNAFHKN